MVNMLGKGEALELLERALRACEADEAEALLMAQNQSLTRYANNHVHQNVVERQVKVTVRAVIGNRSGSASTGRLDPGSLAAAARRAVAIAKVSPGDPEAVALPPPRPLAEVASFDAATAACSPNQRARWVQVITETASRLGLTASGSMTTACGELALANTAGVRAHTEQTRAACTVIAQSATGSGYAAGHSLRAADLDFQALADKAVRKCVESADPRPLPPGDYEVVLEPEAVADLLIGLALAFNGEAVREGRSPFQGKLGELVCDERVTIIDDPLSPDGFPIPFDFEGQPKRRLPLIEAGRVRNFVYNTYTAAKEGKESTGHALPAAYRMFGAVPTNVFVAPGEASLAEMVAATGRGILVTRFNYNRPIHPLKTLITGLTRDGAWYVEDGKVQYPIKNLRYTQSVLEALNSVDVIGRDTELKSLFMLGSARVPAMKLSKFSFTGEAHL